MKRTLTAALVLLLSLTGCGAKKHIDTAAPAGSTPETLVTIMETTVPPRPISERAQSLQKAGDTYIFDEQNVLTDKEKQQYNDYLGWLCSSRQIKAAAVITDALGGISPEEFAKRYYETLFGTGEPGFLVLINNDTNRDFVYCSGSCAAYLGDTASAIAKATPFLVEQKYADALEILLPVGERLSDRVFDRCGALTAEQVQTLTTLSNASEKHTCVLLVNAFPGETPPETAQTETPSETEAVSEEIPDALKSYAEDIRRQTEADSLLVIDNASRTAWLVGGDAETLARVRTALDTEGAFAAASALF